MHQKRRKSLAKLGKALSALRANKPGDARGHLAYRKAPNHPAVNYLYGVYFFQMKDQEKAKSYWSKTLEFRTDQETPESFSAPGRAQSTSTNSGRGCVEECL